ncbi:YIP1 family protein [Methanosarcina sp.]|uniref:YIP1 family protein n=1 Tax=Methanosarcina sp. TaxID=2213 RepID=UPI002AB83B1D|nr:YIP1 family protein [Methanosarcina sp.]MDY9925569.1 YIP1 family protein [Methanosarcina sp.]
MDYIETWKEVIQKPSDFYRKMPTTGGYAEPLTFAAISYFIYGLLTALFNRGMMGGMYGYGMMGTGGYGLSTSLMVAIMMPIMGIISIIIGAAILYIIYKVLGGKGSYEGTVRFVSYATAVLLLSWVPFIGWIFGFYGIYLYILGGMIVHDVSMVKSAIAVLLPTFLVILLVIIMVVLAGSLAYTMIFPS